MHELCIISAWFKCLYCWKIIWIPNGIWLLNSDARNCHSQWTFGGVLFWLCIHSSRSGRPTDISNHSANQWNNGNGHKIRCEVILSAVGNVEPLFIHTTHICSSFFLNGLPSQVFWLQSIYTCVL